ncbi:hypothetical protein INS49_014633 [Diaporthe citri]|uniref:uncharacterized protein n=1 Tax=Diaporthe citri TaxID=83186 RepID=UPI001C7F22E2|nr:uncharacterized protein INS49_014633 [Diaporthe citri]KAG6356759.1 hypothetical protein INS49_014633 [Diaporthe citri]
MSSSDLIDVTAQPAIASWTHENGAFRYLEALRFHIFHDPSTSTAFFKLRATVTFKATGGRPKRTTAAWLHIAPERVETIALEDEKILYGGKGGQVVELDSLDLPGPAGNEASPPPYADIGPSPPFVTDTPVGKKRRRTSSEASATPCREDDSKAIEDKTAFAKALKDDLKAELKAELMSELRADVKAELKDQVKTELVKEVIREIEGRILHRVEERLQEQADDFEKQLYDLRHEFGATIYSEVEDQTYTARKELEDFVQEEMEEAQKRVEERIVDRLECASMNIRFNDR